MKRLILIVLFIAPSLCFSKIKDNKDWLYNMKYSFIFEDQIYVGDVNNGFFQIFNNEASISYGLTKFFAIGIHHDYYYSENSYFSATNHLIGLKGTVSIMPFLPPNKNADFLKKVDLNINGYVSYSSGATLIKIWDKKDHQRWPVYFKLGCKYYLSNKFYLNTLVGIYNTDRIFLGIGLKF